MRIYAPADGAVKKDLRWPLHATFSDSNAVQLSNEVARVIRENPSGFTFDLQSQKCLRDFAVDQFVVSLQGYETGYRHFPNETDVREWLRRSLAAALQPDRYIGGWEEGLYYLDVSMIKIGLLPALVAARNESQKAIYHPASGQSISVAVLDEIQKSTGSIAGGEL